MRLFILGIDEPWGEERSIMSRFLPEYLRVATPMGLMRQEGKGGESNGPIINPLVTSFWRSVVTVSGSAKAD